jgi:polyisoprenoid-binding protein YceI
MSITATRIVAGVELPAPGVWKIDPGHAEVAFIGRHFMLTKVRGRFTGVTGEVRVGDEPTTSSLEVTIDMASVNSGDTARDDHLCSGDFFDVANYPMATFRSSGVEWNGSSGRVVGDLTLKAVTRPVTLDVDYVGHAHDPWDNERAVFSASATINREDWGLTWNMALETGGVVLSKEIRIEIEVETIRQP